MKKVTDSSASIGNPYDDSNLFQRLVYTFVNPLLDKGESEPLNQQDLYPLSQHDKAERVVRILEGHWEEELQAFAETGRKPSLWRALYRSNRFEIWYSATWTFLEHVGIVASPILLGGYINWLQNENARFYIGFIYAIGIGLFQIFRLVGHHILFFYTMRCGWNARTATTGLIHKKVLKLNCADLLEATTGRVVNLVSNDVQRFDEFFVMAHFGWCSPLCLIVVFVLVAVEIGWLASAVGVGLVCVLIPVQGQLGKVLSRMRSNVAGHTDNRVRVMAEVLNGMASVKAFVWEQSFVQKIKSIRHLEMAEIGRSQFLKAVNLGTFLSASIIASFGSFTIFWFQGGELSVGLVVTVLALLHSLRESFGRLFTRAVETGSEAISAAKRISHFLQIGTLAVPRTHESSEECKQRESSEERKQHESSEECKQRTEVWSNKSEKNQFETKPCIARMKDAAVTWKPTTPIPLDPKGREGDMAQDYRPIISNVSLEINPGELIMVIGPVGCGKSTLLSSLLGETAVTHGSCTVAPGTRIGYVGQKPWIQACTFKENITGMISGFDEERYSAVVKACCLEQDVQSFPKKDDSEIGEKGVNLSGGQKARAALARACYCQADLYLLDDPLSAVDPEVSQAIFEKCLGRQGFLKRNTKNAAIVLVTHQIQYLSRADRIVVMDGDGKMLDCGSLKDLNEQGVNVGQLVKEHEEERVRRQSLSTSRPRSRSVTSASIMSEEEETPDKKVGLVEEEDRSVGVVTRKTYFGYIQGGGVVLAIFVMILMIVGQLVVMGADYWLIIWASRSVENQGSFWLFYVFAAVTAASFALGVARGAVFFVFTLRSARRIHYQMLESVMKAPMTFFFSNPSGRILNKFSKDQGNVDELLPPVFYDAVQSGLFCLASIVVVIVSLYWVIFFVIPLVWFFFRARKRFLSSSREIRRLEAISRSPIYAEFSATLDGLLTLRAFGVQNAVHQHFLTLMDTNGQGWFCFLIASRWLGFRLDMETAIFVFAACLLGAGLKGSINAGLLGFGIMYSFSLSGLFQWTVRQTAQVENYMTAVERILYYRGIAPEENVENSKKLAPPNWPSSGALKVKNLDVRYRAELPLVLKNLNFEIPSGSKVGLVGRSGCGKSSLVLALLQLNQVCGGSVIVDDVDLSKMSMKEARKKISWIPQDPHLFSGSLRKNLDPFENFNDAEIWQALEEVQMKDVVSSNPDRLEMHVLENGANLSVGQRQLLSLARAMLLGNKILLMDEATANVDYQTDAIIQQTLRTRPAFKDCTVIVIAHRINTIIDSDLIVVLADGELIEFGSPSELLANQNGTFSRMVSTEKKMKTKK